MLFILDETKPFESTGNLTNYESKVTERTYVPLKENGSDAEQKEKNFECMLANGSENSYNKDYKPSKRFEFQNKMFKLEQKKIDILEKSSKNQTLNNTDSDALYLQSLLPYFYQMHVDDKLLCKKEIMEILCKYAYKSSTWKKYDSKIQECARKDSNTEYVEKVDLTLQGTILVIKCNNLGTIFLEVSQM